MRKSRFIAPLVVALLLGLTLYFGIKNWDSSNGTEEWQARKTAIDTFESNLKALSKEIHTAQGNSQCAVSTQCRVVGLGTRVCGEYKDFLVYSVKDSDETRLLSIVSKFNDTHGKMSALSLAAGECGKKPDRIECLNSICTPVK